MYFIVEHQSEPVKREYASSINTFVVLTDAQGEHSPDERFLSTPSFGKEYETGIESADLSVIWLHLCSS